MNMEDFLYGNERERWQAEQVINRIADTPDGLFYDYARGYVYRVHRRYFEKRAALEYLEKEFGIQEVAANFKLMFLSPVNYGALSLDGAEVHETWPPLQKSDGS